LEEIWVITTAGENFYHYSRQNSDNVSNPLLLNNFLTGIQNFMSDLGGSEFYKMIINDTVIMGMKITMDLKDFYLVGKFKFLKNLNPNKCVSVLERIKNKIRKINIQIDGDRNHNDQLLNNIIGKIKT
jgi:hypothetical protein